MKTKLLILDDHPMTLAGAKSFFDSEQNIDITSRDDIQKVYDSIESLDYDIYLIDINMSPVDGLKVAERIRAFHSESAILLYTGDAIKDYYSYIFEHRLNGIIPKTTSMEEILSIFNLVITQKTVLPLDFYDFISQRMEQLTLKLQLTKKEIELLGFLKEGLTNKEISGKLFVTERSVERYFQQLYEHLNVSNKEEALLKIQEENLI
ncbi:response regulator transcription factor [Lysinibacillus xylanilyticus]|uniref:response regulator transcription factor n=1 Tax=Lysinibacillus xylanilyticus TaxID=582475 RepID=UPI002B245AC8|nr:response regulator transcription factor [Lysinibacillus xylanilyticus]MEB2300317.1 response regulator transcription factor [Lysinibacillus xylanilyticus]